MLLPFRRKGEVLRHPALCTAECILGVLCEGWEPSLPVPPQAIAAFRRTYLSAAGRSVPFRFECRSDACSARPQGPHLLARGILKRLIRKAGPGLADRRPGGFPASGAHPFARPGVISGCPPAPRLPGFGADRSGRSVLPQHFRPGLGRLRGASLLAVNGRGRGRPRHTCPRHTA